jgi:toxin FitB
VHPADLFLSAITTLEIEAGTLMLHRRHEVQGAMLRAWVDSKILPAFDGKILSIDTAAAQRVPGAKA